MCGRLLDSDLLFRLAEQYVVCACFSKMALVWCQTTWVQLSDILGLVSRQHMRERRRQPTTADRCTLARDRCELAPPGCA